MVETNTKNIEEAYKIGEELTKIVNEDIKILQIKIGVSSRPLLLLAKKRYAAGPSSQLVTSGKTHITKGIETVRRDWCD